jgi:dephospho-CoA kinase
MAESKPVVGLIGGIGSGKSLVADAFRQQGAHVISGDALGHDGLRQPDLRDAVVRRWGPDALNADGAVNRRWLAGRVFADPAELRELEAILFPWIGRRIREEVDEARADPSVSLVVLDAAVMLEAGWDGTCDRIVYVHAPRTERLRRLQERRGWTIKEVERREQAQLPLTVKVSRAGYAVDNSGPPEATARQVAGLLRQWGVTPRVSAEPGHPHRQ